MSALEASGLRRRDHPPLIRGVYGHPGALWARGERLDDCGVNAVFVHSGAIDQELLDRARAEGCRVYAEFATLNGRYGDYVTEHPEAHPLDETGRPAPPATWFLGVCPTHAGFRAYRMEALRQLLTRYEVDGVWMDYVHWHAQFEDPYPVLIKTCFSDSCLQAFQEWALVTVPEGTVAARAEWILREVPRAWEDWRVTVIGDWAREIRKHLDELRPGALLGCFHVAWRDEDLGGVRRRCLGVDLPVLARYVDVFSPMPYHGRAGLSPEYVREYVEYFSGRYPVQTEPGAYPRLWPIVQAEDNPRVTPEELEQVLRYGLSGKSTGVMMFTTTSVAEDPGKLAAMRRVYEV